MEYVLWLFVAFVMSIFGFVIYEVIKILRSELSVDFDVSDLDDD